MWACATRSFSTKLLGRHRCSACTCTMAVAVVCNMFRVQGLIARKHEHAMFTLHGADHSNVFKVANKQPPWFESQLE